MGNNMTNQKIKPDPIITRIRKELKEKSDEKTRQSGERFFKEEVLLYGLKSAHVAEIAKRYWKEIKDQEKEEIFFLCEELWETGYLEEAIIACKWSYGLNKSYEEKDFAIFEKWVAIYISNWATCDTFCNHNLGAFIEKYPQYLERLKQWARSENRWVRRAAAVSLIVPARQGKFLEDIFALADILLLDKDDMVQKGYGWLLKVASQAHQQAIFDYVIRNKALMPRTALRYAIEKMPKDLRELAMAR